jgi:hypothetical protein
MLSKVKLISAELMGIPFRKGFRPLVFQRAKIVSNINAVEMF